VDTRAGLDDVEKRKFLTLPGLELRKRNDLVYVTLDGTPIKFITVL
jgi:ribosomal protein L30/L7E